jgi:hypothetical protein
MDDVTRINLQVTVDDLMTSGWADRRDLSKEERLTRSLKIFGIFFGAAFLCLFVPILHFILPPLSLIVGTVLAINEYSGRGEVLRGEITCPNCKKLMELPTESEEWPLTRRCTGCSFNLTLNKIN